LKKLGVPHPGMASDHDGNLESRTLKEFDSRNIYKLKDLVASFLRDTL